MDDYSILGVSSNEPIEVITKKYKKLAKQYHPDRNINNKSIAEEKFKEISRAYHNIINKKTKTYGTFTSTQDGQFKFTHIFNKINNMRDYIKNMDYEDIIDNVIDKVSTFNEFIDSQNTNLEKTEDLYINANIDLFDIYNNIEKTINIDRLRKCETCKTIKLEHCSECKSHKYINKNVELIFECKLKNIVFHKLSHHYPNKTPGNIIVNIIPKQHNNYNIYNTYDLIYRYIIDNVCKPEIILSFKHLDNKNYSFKILNPQLNYKYKVEQLGLLHNSDEEVRGDLYIILHKNIDINTNIIKI
jgi:DnaJ-class molecular chaperone